MYSMRTTSHQSLLCYQSSPVSTSLPLPYPFTMNQRLAKDMFTHKVKKSF